MHFSGLWFILNHPASFHFFCTAPIHTSVRPGKGTLPKPGTINRELAILKRLFNQAKGDGLFSGDNPVYGKTAGSEEKDYGISLTEPEAVDLLNALENNNKGLLIEFLLATGLRFTNGARLRWSEIDMINRRLVGIDMKAGKDGIPLSDWAWGIIERTHRIKGSPFVFPHVTGRYAGKPYGQIRKTFKTALRVAGLDSEIRIHDLRHSFGSWLGDRRVSEATIAKLMNHKQTSTTTRYTHPSQDALRVTANEIVGPDGATATQGGGPAGGHSKYP